MILTLTSIVMTTLITNLKVIVISRDTTFFI